MAEPGNPPDRHINRARRPAPVPGAAREVRRLLRVVPDALRTRRARRRSSAPIEAYSPTDIRPPVEVRPPASASATMTDLDVMKRLTKLGALRDSGIVTAAEFEAKKAELLRRL
ncbi:SHOCT domain-containing protein [Streptomyces sp. SID3343]|uniref:SHOCT domain-containing protein n=1 Tax=Streptomyces sp. SID3343 TaxID=2690260 RepID=UPI00136BAA38|nr:SHOCT domain-containing protein [Streptomyces sp. SID3343]MYW01714.1 hypothetical protein [Streptomyces sp. SID3343]